MSCGIDEFSVHVKGCVCEAGCFQRGLTFWLQTELVHIVGGVVVVERAAVLAGKGWQVNQFILLSELGAGMQTRVDGGRELSR